ncbi:hypothetical protein, partial [Cereibacter sphaeroides]|uniref:hypothetical protein n=1 Tax=Cereibacter sphaeroides TaxID=1063 RepID=UPI001B354C07
GAAGGAGGPRMQGIRWVERGRRAEGLRRNRTQSSADAERRGCGRRMHPAVWAYERPKGDGRALRPAKDEHAPQGGAQEYAETDRPCRK